MKRSQELACAVDHDAVLEESGPAAALHANQISQLRGLFVHWHRWLLRARGPPSSLPLLTDPHTHTYTQTYTGSNGHPGSHQHIPASFHPSASSLALSPFCLSWFLLSCSRYVCSFQTLSICFVLSVFLFVFVYRKRINIKLQAVKAWLSFRGSDSLHFNRGDDGCPAEYALDTHTHTHIAPLTGGGNRDRSQPDLTIAQRKRSIKQQVHFSAEAFKNMAAITLWELC